ncbi:MAG: tetratricopeptide repeat protein [Phaeodactylibacter sp.]|nr:tetratricopeptide repeat protein [Phaeodactylibacter sp.]
MDKAQLISEVKELLGNAETEKALGRLTDFLRSSPEYKELYSLALQARARFRKAQQDEIQGLASSEQTKLSYNQATRQSLQVVEWLEAGNLKPDASFAEEARPARWPWVAGAVALVLLLAGGWYFRDSFRQGRPEGPQTTDCPIDDPFRATSRFNILLRPFQSVAGEGSPKPHITIATRLQDFIKGLEIDCDFGTMTDVDPNSFFSDADAEAAANTCRAHLIIWGTVEKPSPTDSFTIQTRYKFVKQDSFVKVYKLELAEGSEIVKVDALSIIPTGTTLTQSIFESIKLLFGLIAHETGDREKAIAMLEEYKPEPDDTTANLIKGMLLGDEYIARGQEDQAWEAYSQLLETHDYPLARNNRGVLNYKKGNFEEAAEDLSVFLEAKPDNAEALEIRGSAYLNAERLQNAREDLQKVQEMRAAPSPELNRKLKEVNTRIEQEEQAKASADAAVRANPNNLAAWNQKAVSSLKLGNYQEAVRAGEAILSRDRDNVDAFVQIIKAYRSAGDTARVEKTIRRAEEAGISRRQLDRLTPFSLFQTPTFRFPIKRKTEQ